MFTPEEIDRLRRGGRVEIGNSVYMMCWQCRSVIKVNKFLLGSAHFCTEEDDQC